MESSTEGRVQAVQPPSRAPRGERPAGHTPRASARGRIDTAPRHHSPGLDEQTEEEHRIEREERVIGAIQAAILAAPGGGRRPTIAWCQIS